MKTLKEISWLVDESTYRNDEALSYSTLAKYEREGFSSLPHLFDRIETPSLLLGSMVDCYITDGPEEYENTYFVADFPQIGDKLILIIKDLFNIYGTACRSLNEIKDEVILDVICRYEYQGNWRADNRIKSVREKGETYYTLLSAAIDKQLVSQEMHNTAMQMCRALKESPATKWYFESDDPFDDNIKRYYQLKFKTTINGIDLRCMFDELIVNTGSKLIQPIDLKTSGKPEYNFYKSFVEWRYDVQSRLYVAILKSVLSQYPEFNDYIILPYKFIVINKESLTPLVWDFEDTHKTGTLYYGANAQIEMRDPIDIAKELKGYLDSHTTVPNGITINKSNSLNKWFQTIK